MAVVDFRSDLGLKKLFGEETEEEARAAEELAAAAVCAAEERAAEKRAAEKRAAEDLAAAAKAAGEWLHLMKRLLEAFFGVKLDGLNWGACLSLFTYLRTNAYAYVYGLPACTYHSDTSKVLTEGIPRLYTCLCYPKEELKKEDEEWYGPRYEQVLALLPKMFRVLAIKQIYNKEPMPKMFNDWAKTHGKRYDSVYEWRLRYKIWCSAKKVTEQRCARTGQTFSIDEMSRSADRTVIEREQLHGCRPSELPVSEVKRSLLKTMGKGWMKEVGKGFAEWEERHKRVYSSTEERDDRLIAYLDNMRRIELMEKHYPGRWGHGSDLENMDKFPWEAELVPVLPCSRCRPHK